MFVHIFYSIWKLLPSIVIIVQKYCWIIFTISLYARSRFSYNWTVTPITIRISQFLRLLALWKTIIKTFCIMFSPISSFRFYKSIHMFNVGRSFYFKFVLPRLHVVHTLYIFREGEYIKNVLVKLCYW